MDTVRHNFQLFALFFACTAASAQEQLTTVPLAEEAICGYRGKYISTRAVNVKQGLSVQLLSGDATAGQTIPLRLLVQDKPAETPVEDLQIEHEKFMHLIGVRDDLSGFVHLHPQKDSPEVWQVIHSFTSGGRYQFWADVKRAGTVYSFRQPVLTISGKINATSSPKIPKLTDARDGYIATLSCAEPIVAGRTNSMEVLVRNGSGTQTGMEFYLGSIMHLVIIKDDLSVYLHGHAENHDKSEKTVRFRQIFPQPGNYKLFAQFRPQGAVLGRDDAILAEFWVQVKKAE